MKTTAAVFAALFLFRLTQVGFVNDHFDRIQKGRQILVWSEVPFRDFFDPGFFLTLYSSTAAQWVFGHSLLGEALLTIAFIAAGFTIAFALGRQLSGSTGIALLACAFGAATLPRLYNYDKVLFFPLGIWLAWRYATVPSVRRLVVMAIGSGVAALYRYDNGVYLACGAATAIVSTHWRDPRVVFRRLALYGVVAAATLLPAAMFVHATAGLPNALAQIRDYGRREALRTGIFALPTFQFNASAITREQMAINAAAWLSWVLLALPVLAIAAATRACAERTLLLSAAAVCLSADVFILRAPLSARVGDVAAPAVHLAAWALSRFRGRVVFAVGALTAISIAVLSAPSVRLPRPERLKALADSPPSLAWSPGLGHVGLVQYLRACTRPDDRVLATWFVPELYYFSGRSLAGGMSVFFGGHWSEPERQQIAIARLQSQRVPLVIREVRRHPGELATFEALDEYVRANYELAGQTPLGDPAHDYEVWRRRDAPPAVIDAVYGLPCWR